MKRPWWGATRYLVVRSLAHPDACVRACMRTQVCAGFTYFIAIVLARSQTTVPALGDRQFGLFDVTKARREDRQTRLRLRDRTLRGAWSKRKAEPPPQRDADCQDSLLSGHVWLLSPRILLVIALVYWQVATADETHLSIMNFASGNLNLQPWNVQKKRAATYFQTRK